MLKLPEITSVLPATVTLSIYGKHCSNVYKRTSTREPEREENTEIRISKNLFKLLHSAPENQVVALYFLITVAQLTYDQAALGDLRNTPISSTPTAPS